jgi:hypothetical protein
MNLKAHGKETAARPEEHSKPAWFATFMVLDISGAISWSQLQSLIAPIKKLWQKTLGYS